MTIVVTGEALFDLVLTEDGSVRAHPGGGPFTAARAIARLGAPATFLGGISTDRFGEQLAAELAADGVTLDASLRTDDPTTIAMAELSAEQAATYRFYSEGTSAAGLTPAVALAALPSEVEALLVGTLGLVIEPMAQATEALVEEVDATVLMDVNVRPEAIADEGAYRARLTRLLARTDVLKASDHDLAWIDPGADPVDAARSLGTPVTLLTRGGRGATVVTTGEAIDIPAPAVEVVDTIGAGDAFAGAFLVARRDGAEMADAAAFATRVASFTCSRAGADPPTRAELGD